MNESKGKLNGIPYTTCNRISNIEYWNADTDTHTHTEPAWLSILTRNSIVQSFWFDPNDDSIRSHPQAQAQRVYLIDFVQVVVVGPLNDFTASFCSEKERQKKRKIRFWYSDDCDGMRFHHLHEATQRRWAPWHTIATKFRMEGFCDMRKLIELLFMWKKCKWNRFCN